MKGILIVGLVTVFMTSCSESFDNIDSTEFNESIATRTDIKTAEELIMLYYGSPESEGVPDISIQTMELEFGKIQVTMVHDKLMDDSMRAVKIIMTVEQKDQSWIVLEIKKNWKCWEGRGHTNWGTEYCN